MTVEMSFDKNQIPYKEIIERELVNKLYDSLKRLDTITSKTRGDIITYSLSLNEKVVSDPFKEYVKKFHPETFNKLEPLYEGKLMDMMLERLS